jgi:hypothetical protein
MIFSNIDGVNNNMFFSIIHPQLFQGNKNFNKDDYKYFINSKHTIDFMKNGANSNPVIVLFNFKEF